ncbi:hypothetical protein C0992_011558 [Termitomyces sp. T32_za158]|nr:hypothetical protein C0992_011558 [Termitomyces sp. T32_za158]
MHADSSYPAPASSSSPAHYPYPTSRCEAELCWEFERQKLRTHIAALPSSSFAKTQFEEDEGFYATFPEARQAAINRWIAENFPFAPWADSQVAQYQSSIGFTHNTPFAPCDTNHIAAPTPAVSFITYTLGGALIAPPPRPPRKMDKVSAVPKVPTPPMPSVHYDYSGSATGHDVFNSPASVRTADRTLFNDQERLCIDQEAFSAANGPQALTPTPPEDDDLFRTLELLAPARRSGKHVRKVQVHSPPRARIIKNPYPSASPASSRSTVDTPPSTPPSSRSPITPVVVPSNAPVAQLRFTGDWEIDNITTAEYLYSAFNLGEKPLLSIPVPELPLLDIEPHIDADIISIRHRRHHDTHRRRPHPYSPPSPRPYPHPRSRSHSDSPSREHSKSASPPNKRPKMLRDKNGKPIMACLFCRGRKIACGPPPKGSNDPTCNQCARRGQDCQYPLINRRGMRKKKTPVDAHDVASEASCSPSSNITGSTAPELVKVDEDVAISDGSDESGSDWGGDD